VTRSQFAHRPLATVLTESTFLDELGAKIGGK
jgi:hypothetical protein